LPAVSRCHTSSRPFPIIRDFNTPPICNMHQQFTPIATHATSRLLLFFQFLQRMLFFISRFTGPSLTSYTREGKVWPPSISHAITLFIQCPNTCDTFVCTVYFPSHSIPVSLPTTVHTYILLFVVTPTRPLLSRLSPNSPCLGLDLGSQTCHLCPLVLPPFFGSVEWRTDSEVGMQGERGH
jgi:hypothetical protein